MGGHSVSIWVDRETGNMALNKNQIKSLLDTVASSQPDELDCDGCFELIAEFAETRLAGQPLSEAMQAVETHLQNCACCQDEFETLLSALREIDTSYIG